MIFKKMGYLFWLTVVASIALAGLTVYQAYDKVKSDRDAINERKTAESERLRADEARRETKLAQEKSEKYLNDLKLANEKIQNLNKESLQKTNEIIQKNNEVINAQIETIRSVTGFGIPLAVAGRSAEKDGHFFVTNKGNYNLKNLTVSIYDFSNDLKTFLTHNTLSNKIFEKNLLGTNSITTLAPYSTMSIHGTFDYSQLKAFEIRMYTDHGEFREFFIGKFNVKSKSIEHFYYKLYEINRLTSKWQILEQKPEDTSKDYLFERYFIMHNYMLFFD